MMRYLEVTGKIKTLRETGPGGLCSDKGRLPYRASMWAWGAKLVRNFTMVMRPSLSLRQALLPDVLVGTPAPGASQSWSHHTPRNAYGGMPERHNFSEIRFKRSFKI
jgi:hypothetical protein